MNAFERLMLDSAYPGVEVTLAAAGATTATGVRAAACGKPVRVTIFSKARAMPRRVELIDRWPDWPNRIVMLVGDPGSGKSHLAVDLGGERRRPCYVQRER